MAAESTEQSEGNGKPANTVCIACREHIPPGAQVCSHCGSRQTSEKESSGKRVMAWVGSTSAVLALAGTLWGGVRWAAEHRQHQKEVEEKLTLADSQVQQGGFRSAMSNYADVLKTDSGNREAQQKQLDAAMAWVEDFHTLEGEERAAKDLDQIMSVLERGLISQTGTRKADVQAHLGWAHFLNKKMTHREFGPAADQNLRDALAADPGNVYALAMLANKRLQSGGKLAEALPDFHRAEASQRARPIVRSLELGGLVYLDQPGARAEVVRIVDAMRKGGEVLDNDQKGRIASFCYGISLTSESELRESLSAVPGEDAWQTYRFVVGDPMSDEDEAAERTTAFIRASLKEIAGHKEEALAQFKILQGALKKQPGTLQMRVDAAVKRLS